MKNETQLEAKLFDALYYGVDEQFQELLKSASAEDLDHCIINFGALLEFVQTEKVGRALERLMR